MENFYVDKVFLSIDGILINKGITSYDPDKALLSKRFIEHANESIVLTDHSKIGLSTLYKIADIKEIDIIVSDIDAPKNWVEELNAKDVNWIVAE